MISGTIRSQMGRTLNLVMLTVVISIMLLFSGCSLKYTMDDPVLSSINYPENNLTPTVLSIVDKRDGSDVYFTIGKIGFASLGDISSLLNFKNIDDPIAYFALNLEAELNKRKIPVKCVVGSTERSDIILEVYRYQIVNYRATGFSPWEAGHVFDGILSHNGNRKKVTAYFYNGKTPVWSMNEILDPCFNIPSSILIQDVASKLNKLIFKLHSSDAEVNHLVNTIDTELMKSPNNAPFWMVLELGNTNNTTAIDPLKKYAKVGDEFFKSCAISAIGTLGTTDDLDFLKQVYDDAIYNEKYMAVKAIGDIGGVQAMNIIKEAKNEGIYESEGGFKTAVDLYQE